MGLLRNPHPGEILKEEFLTEIGMSQNQLGHAIGVPPNRIHAIVNGTRDVTADTDLRLSKFFGLSEGYFLRLQKRLRHAGSEARYRGAGRENQALQGPGNGLKRFQATWIRFSLAGISTKAQNGRLAGAAGFEPAYTGTKNRRLTAWLRPN